MKLASIETITAIRPHNNADRLAIAQVLGWQVIVKKGDFQEGDRVVLIVIDTILPRAPWSDFLADPKDPEKPIRLRTIKLRGEYSQGLVLPLSVLPEHVREWQTGVDVGGTLGIKKYEKEIPACLSGEVLEAFPTYLAPRTDEDNGLSNPSLVEEVLRSRDLCVTQKLDGSSCTIIVDSRCIRHVCSRNLSLKRSETNAFWRVANKMDVSVLSPDASLVIQGELMGPGVQGNQLELKEPTLYVFQIYDRKIGKWLSYVTMAVIARGLGFEYVPEIVVHSTTPVTLDYLQRLADRQILPNGKPAEGIVVRPAYPVASGSMRPLGFKIINRNYGE